MSAGQSEQVSVDPIAKLRQQRVAKELENWSAYSSMLRDIAQGVEVDSVEVDLVLQMVGRTPEQLEADVSKMRRRLQLADQLARRPEMGREVAELERVHDEAAKRYWSETKRLEQAAELARHKLAMRRAELSQLLWVEDELRRGCLDLPLLRREEQLRERIRPLAEEIRDLQGQLEGQLVRMDSEADQLSRDPNKEGLAETIEERRRSIDEIQKRLAGVRQKYDAAQSELGEITELKLVP